VIRTVSERIESIDFVFENSLVRIVAGRNTSEIKLAGLSVGPFEEGNDYEVCYWVAVELAKSGIAHFHTEDLVDAAKLSKIQWTERVQTAGQISKLPGGFYPKLRRYIAQLREGIANSPEKMREYERADQLTRDIVNSRLKKIVSIASGPAQTEGTLRNLTEEERVVYDQLFKIINGWRTQILNHKGGT
jgi:hypothetical protein